MTFSWIDIPSTCLTSPLANLSVESLLGCVGFWHAAINALVGEKKTKSGSLRRKRWKNPEKRCKSSPGRRNNRRIDFGGVNPSGARNVTSDNNNVT